MTRKRRIHFLLPLGCLALIALMGTPKLIQYAILPNDELGACADRIDDVAAQLSGAAPAVTIHGVKSGVPLAAAETTESDVTLYMIGPRWNEVYPRPLTAGEGLGYAALKGKQRQIVLDSSLAFRLFGDNDPIGQFVKLSGESFEVTGVARHTRRIGETGQYAAWIPLGSDETLGCDLMVATAVSDIDGGLMTLFGSAAKDAFGEGTLFGLRKERMRAGMILRLIALVAVIRLLGLWIGVLKRLGGAWLSDYRARSQTRYFRQLLGFVTLRVLAMALLCAATLAACWGLMNFFVQPVLVFVEWVPEVLVSFASIKGRFWELVNAASRPVSFVTAELAEVRFWSVILRWGVIMALIGGVMTLASGFSEGKRGKTVNYSGK